MSTYKLTFLVLWSVTHDSSHLHSRFLLSGSRLFSLISLIPSEPRSFSYPITSVVHLRSRPCPFQIHMSSNTHSCLPYISIIIPCSIQHYSLSYSRSFFLPHQDPIHSSHSPHSSKGLPNTV